jgi:hypothetical protein
MFEIKLIYDTKFLFKKIVERNKNKNKYWYDEDLVKKVKSDSIIFLFNHISLVWII